MSIEFLVHAWDFAQATGQQVTVPDALTEHVLGVARTVIRPGARDGVQFGEVIEEDKQFYRSLVPAGPAVEVKPMFGNLGALVNGNMFAGLFGAAVGVRLDASTRRELEAIDGSGPFGPAARPMAAYTSMPAAWGATPELAERWVAMAMSQASALPPKVKQAKPKSQQAGRAH